jgi:hypothetical protein
VAFFLERYPTHHVTDTYRERRPKLVDLVARLELHDRADKPLDQVIPHIWDELAA